MQISQDLADRLATISIEQYKKLPKTGKPAVQGNKVEWTVLACILQVVQPENTEQQPSIKVVSLGYGKRKFFHVIYTDDVMWKNKKDGPEVFAVF